MHIKILNMLNNLFQPYAGLLAIFAIIISIISGLFSIFKPLLKKIIDFVKYINWKFKGDFKLTAEYDGIYPLKNNSLLYSMIKKELSINPNYLIIIKIYIDRFTQNENSIRNINFCYKPLSPLLKACSKINNTEFYTVTENKYNNYSQMFKDYSIPKSSPILILILCSEENPINTRVRIITVTDKNNKKYCAKVKYKD